MKKIIFFGIALIILAGIFYYSGNKDLKINYLTVHISSGLTALKAVKKISQCKIVGVSTLTSLNNKDLKTIGYNRSIKNLVSHQAKLAKRAGLDALVCSPYEVNIVRKVFKKEIITPGVQIGKKNYDQKHSLITVHIFSRSKKNWSMFSVIKQVLINKMLFKRCVDRNII